MTVFLDEDQPISQRDDDASDAYLRTCDPMGIVKRRWRWMVAGLMAGVILAACYCQVAPRQFQSSAQILVMQKDTGFSGRTSDLGTGTVDARLADDLLATHMELIRSPIVVLRAMDQHDLRSLSSISSALGEGQSPASYIVERLRVTRGGKGQSQSAHILNVTCTHSSSADSGLILDAIIQSYSQFVRKTFQAAGSEAVKFISQAKNDLAKEISEKENNYRTFREQTNLLWSGNETVNVHQIRLIEIEKSISENQLRHAQVKSRVEIVEKAITEESEDRYSDLERLALIDDADMHRLSLLVDVGRGDRISEAFQALQPARAATASAEYDQLLTLRMDAEKLKADLGRNHPKLIEAQQTIGQLEQFLTERKLALGTTESSKSLDASELIHAYVRLLRHDLIELDRRHNELQAMANQERESTKQLVSAELLGESLRRDVERTQALYDTVMQRLQEISTVKDYGGLITEMIKPIEPGKPSWPKRSFTLALGAVAGVLVGSTIALWRELSDQTFRGPHDIRQSLKLDVLTHLPDLSREGKRGNREIRSNGNAAVDIKVLSYQRPQSHEAETFRGLRTSLCFGLASGIRKVIQITSPTSGDGKTTLISNLAISLAQGGQRILVVDCDLRRPRLHEEFSVASDIGLSCYLADEAEFQEVVSPTQCENVFVVPGGPVVSNPSDLLSRDRFKQFIEEAREHYDCVLVDGSPILEFSDARAVAARVDAVLLLVRITRNGRATALQSRRLLDELGTQVLGVVVNGSGKNGSYAKAYN